MMQHLEHVSEKPLEYRYPYESDTGLYAMVSVSELKKQEADRTGRGCLARTVTIWRGSPW